ALTTVAELLQPNLWAIARSVGGAFFFLGGLIGLLLLLLPKDRWHWWHVAVLLCGTALYGYSLTRAELSRSATVGLFAVPLAGRFFWTWVVTEAPRHATRG